MYLRHIYISATSFAALLKQKQKTKTKKKQKQKNKNKKTETKKQKQKHDGIRLLSTCFAVYIVNNLCKNLEKEGHLILEEEGELAILSHWKY